MSSGSARALAQKLHLEDLDVAGARVLVRADLNLPVQSGVVTDDTRLRATLPTLEALLDAGATLVVMSHRGRPKGERRPELGMAPVAEAMGQALGREVTLMPDCVGAEVEAALEAQPEGSVALLENLRFHAAETENDPEFAAQLGKLADIYVDDAFGAAHRAHASVVGVTAFVDVAAAGKLLELEVGMLSRCLESPEQPFVLVAGGAKVSDKLDAVSHLMPLVDKLIIGGAMANSVLTAQGANMGRSHIEEGSLELADALLHTAEANKIDLLLPDDFVVARGIDDGNNTSVVRLVPETEMALDIGPESAERFAAALADARTVLWNGPMGVFEVEAFAAGTERVGEAIANLTTAGGLSIVGGGDTVAAVARAGLAERMSHVSTGGGASLDLLSGAVLPGIEALTDRSS